MGKVRSLIEIGALRIVTATAAPVAASADPASGPASGPPTDAPAAAAAAAALSTRSVALTALGHHVARLPVAPRLAKLLVLGALLGCLEEALTVAASLSEKSAFCGPFDKVEQGRRVLARL